MIFELCKDLIQSINSPAKANEELKKYTSLNIGGPCFLLIEVENDEDIIKGASYLKQEKLPYFFLGNGSNLLVSDKGFPGIILKLGKKYDYTEIFNYTDEECYVKVGASKPLPALTMELAKKSIDGIEWGCMIPGTLGGASIMNAGAHGGEMSQVLTRIEAVDIDKEEKVTLSRDEFDFDYRSLNTGGRNLLVTSVWLKLKRGQKNKIMKKIDEFKKFRKNKQPESPNAGSVFKNPPGDYAGRLLEECGMKGFGVGGVKFYEKHANIIVNVDNGKAEDVWKLIGKAKKKVKENYGVELSLELKVLGEML